MLGERSPCAIALADETVTVFGPDRINALEQDNGRSPLIAGARALCCVPLVTARGVLGTLNLTREDADSLTPTTWR